jgi:hypothetical protein
MKQILSLFMFGIGTLLFLAFFATLKPTDVTAASGPDKPGRCSTKASPSITCRSLTFDTAWWSDVARKN